MAYQSLQTVVNALASRLNDPTQTFFTNAELVMQVQNSLRFWNALTGESRIWYQFNLAQPLPFVWATPVVFSEQVAQVWYDLQTITGSPRQSTLTDRDVYSWIQYALLEPQVAAGTPTTAQFGPNDFIQAVQRKRDEYLMRTGCTLNVVTLPVFPDISILPMPAATIEAQRGYWLPGINPSTGQPWGTPGPLMRSDEQATGSYQSTWFQTQPGDTLTYSAGVEVPLTVTLAPPPGFPGNAEFLCTNVQGQLSQAGATLLLMPDDLVPALLWGAIADLLDSSLEANDTMRAAYARSRFEQHIELASIYPSILAARVAEVDTYVDAVETLDSYMPQWEVTNSDPSIVATAGQNLVAFPNIDLNYITVLMVANAPLPTAPTDPVPVGAEVLDVVIDYAAHAASFKMGGAEFEATMPLFKSIIELAGHRNAEIRALSTFRDVLYGRTHRDQQFALLERDLGKVSYSDVQALLGQLE